MTLLTESDLAKCEPAFLWKRPTAYQVVKHGATTTFVFGRPSRFDRFSTIALFTVMSVLGIVEILVGWPLYVAILPWTVVVMGLWLNSLRRRKLEGCMMEITSEGVLIVDPPNRVELPPLIEVRVQNRWKRRDGSFGSEGDSELFLAVEDAQGHTLFFPLADAGLLQTLDVLALD